MYRFSIVEEALANNDFRRVITTGTKSQVVLMSLLPGEEIGEEVHHDIDQTLVFVSGRGTAVIKGDSMPVTPNNLFFIPAGTLHNFINSGSEPLKLYTVYAPAEHPDKTVHHTKEDALRDEHHHE